MKERLNKYIARCGICSRRKADEFIAQGFVKVNNLRVTEMGHIVDTDRDKVTFKQNPVSPVRNNIYVILNKPEGYITTLKDPEKRPTVTDLLVGIKIRLNPVGRLDQDTEGLLIMTNDGDVAYRLAHPRYGVKKTYVVSLNGYITETQAKKLEKGVLLEDGITAPAEVTLLKRFQNHSEVQIRIAEGKKRQVRRMFEAMGFMVKRLIRTEYGPLKLGRLQKGQYRELTPNEVRELHNAVFIRKTRTTASK
jgi:pseudouridine synthase